MKSIKMSLDLSYFVKNAWKYIDLMKIQFDQPIIDQNQLIN